MSFAFTVCANGTGRTRAGGKCSKHSWCEKGRGRKIWIGRLALFNTVSYKVVFFEKMLNDSFGGEVGIGGHRVDVLLYGSEVFVHAVKQDDSENVVKFDRSHCVTATSCGVLSTLSVGQRYSSCCKGRLGSTVGAAY